MMKLRFWGTRGSIAVPGPSTTKYGGNTSCVELRSDGQIIIFDAGTGIRELGHRLLEEFRPRPLAIHIFISHTHWDHIQGFPFFLPAYEPQNKVYLYGPPGRDKSLERIMKIQMDSDYFPVELGDMSPHIEVHEVRRSVKVGRLTVLPFYLNHPSMCLAYRVTDGKRSIVYATDNEPYTGTLHRKPSKTSKPTDLPTYLDEKFVQFLSNADLYIGEGQYTTDEYKEKRGWGHSPIESTIQFAVQANVKRLVLFHHDPLHDDAFVDRMVREAKQLIAFYGGKIDCVGAQEGMEIVIP